MTVATHTPASDIATLQNMMSTQSTQANDLLHALTQIPPNPTLQPAVDYVGHVLMVRVIRAHQVLSSVSADQAGLARAVQAVVTYVNETEALSDLDVLLSSVDSAAAGNARRAYAALVSARLSLSIEIEDLLDQVVPPAGSGAIEPAPAHTMTFDQFNAYLANVQLSIDFIRDNNTDLPSASALKGILDSWRVAIETYLPVDVRDGDAIPQASLTPLPSRAELIDAYAAVDRTVTRLIDEITDILSDRNLEDLTIL